MNRDPVKSSNITSIGYDAEARHLEVEFSSGGVYQYHGVSPDEHKALIASDSIGKHFHAHIRGNYQAHKQ